MNQRLVASAEEMAGEPVPAVEAPGVGAQQPLHAEDEIGLRRFGDEIK